MKRLESDGHEPAELPVTDAMIAAGAAAVREWFPFDGERPAISQAEAVALAGSVLRASLSEVARDDLREIKRDLGTIKDSFGQLATKSDMVTWKWQWVAVAIGLITFAITGMAGGLALVAYVLTPH